MISAKNFGTQPTQFVTQLEESARSEARVGEDVVLDTQTLSLVWPETLIDSHPT